MLLINEFNDKLITHQHTPSLGQMFLVTLTLQIFFQVIQLHLTKTNIFCNMIEKGFVIPESNGLYCILHVKF